MTKNNTRTKLSLVILTMMFSINVFIPLLLCHPDIATSTGTDSDIKNITTSKEKFPYHCAKKNPRTAMATSYKLNSVLL